MIPPLRLNGMPTSDGQLVSDTLPVEITCEPVVGAVAARLLIGDDDLGPPRLTLGDPLWRWTWQPRGRVGSFAARLSTRDAKGVEEVRAYPVALAPAKIGDDQFEALLRGIQQAASALIFALHGGGVSMAPSPEGRGPRAVLEDYWTRLAQEARLVTTLVRSLERRPYRRVQYVSSERPLAEIVEARGETIARLAERPLDEPMALRGGPGARRLAHIAGRGGLPRSLPVRETVTDAHLPEHQLLARVLAELLSRCLYLRAELRREIRWRERGEAAGRDDVALRALVEWDMQAGAVARSLQRARSVDFLAGVEPARQPKGTTPLMQRDARYRRIGRLWRALTDRPVVALQSPAFDLPVRDLPTLYELWCLLEVASVLGTIGTAIEQRLVETVTEEHAGIQRSVWKVQPVEDRPLLRRRLPGGAELALYYRRRYQPRGGEGGELGSLDPFLRIPDIVIEVVRPADRPSVLILDAKYRVAANGGVPEDALADAYAYHGSVGYQGQLASEGACLLFPGTERFEAGGVAALPTLPGQTSALGEWVRRRFQQSIAKKEA